MLPTSHKSTPNLIVLIWDCQLLKIRVQQLDISIPNSDHSSAAEIAHKLNTYLISSAFPSGPWLNQRVRPIARNRINKAGLQGNRYVAFKSIKACSEFKCSILVEPEETWCTSPQYGNFHTKAQIISWWSKVLLEVTCNSTVLNRGSQHPRVPQDSFEGATGYKEVSTRSSPPGPYASR